VALGRLPNIGIGIPRELFKGRVSGGLEDDPVAIPAKTAASGEDGRGLRLTLHRSPYRLPFTGVRLEGAISTYS